MCIMSCTQRVDDGWGFLLSEDVAELEQVLKVLFSHFVAQCPPAAHLASGASHAV